MKVQIIDNASEVYILNAHPGLSNTAVFPSVISSYLLLEYGPRRPDIYTEGVISHGALNHLSERTCVNMQLKGNLISISTADISTMLAPYKVNITTDSVLVPYVQFFARRTTTCRASDLHYDSIPSRIEHLPDFTSAGVQYKDITVAFWEPEPDVWFREVYWWFSVNSGASWSSVSFISGFQIDRLTKRYRRSSDGTTWTAWANMSIYRLIRKGAGSLYPTSDSLPNSWEDYQRLLEFSEKYHNFPLDSDVYGDLVRRCANDARVVQTNGLELAAELSQITNSVTKVLTLAGKGVSPQVLGAAYLSYKYGLRLTGIGVKAVFDNVADELYRRYMSGNIARSRAKERIYVPSLSSFRPDCLVEYNYKMFHSRRSGDWRDSLRNWFDSGLFPSLTNVWDMVPLSFVFDWFVRMEDYLNAIDANTYWSLYTIYGVTYSQKRTFNGMTHFLSKAGYTFFGDCVFTDYRRYTASSAHKPLYFEPSPREFKNYAELTALFVANL